jgi:hypothetical protein
MLVRLTNLDRKRVDADGKEVTEFDKEGRPIKTVV